LLRAGASGSSLIAQPTRLIGNRFSAAGSRPRLLEFPAGGCISPGLHWGRLMFRRLLGASFLALAGFLAFKLFEPVFTWKLGWADLPNEYPVSTAPAGADRTALAADLDAMLVAARNALDAPSISAAISVEGEIVWASAAGYADIGAKVPATVDTVYRLGSTSKAVSSVAAGVLIDQDAIDLEAPLSRYMPDLSAPLANVTVRQAMSHTAGVRNYGLCFCFPVWEHLNRKRYEGAQRETLRSFEASPLLFSPGEGFAYTSLGYNALGGVIEAASGARFADFLGSAVTGPLAMQATAVEDGSLIASLAAPYEVENGQYKRAFRVDNSNKYLSGGIVSTPSDMTRLGYAMLAASLFTPATRDALINPQKLNDGSANDQGYALGWRYNSAGTLRDGALVTPRYGHHGTAQGAASYFAVYPDYGLVVSVMMNKGQTNLDALSERAAPFIERVIEDIERRPTPAEADKVE
jgi:CubicO group peptidase (beta-lactamase class C family)